jgi:hypothetical protein
VTNTTNNKRQLTLTTHLDWALHYASQGVFVFRICEKGKVPLAGESWPEISTTDAETIKAWWTDRPLANIGLDCGKSGALVIDADCKRGKNGLINLFDLEYLNTELDLGPLPKSIRTRTPSGGGHIIMRTEREDEFFVTPRGERFIEIRNSQSKIAEDIDVRGVGGYVLLPPSVAPIDDKDLSKGFDCYRWTTEADFEQAEACPGSWEARLRELQSARRYRRPDGTFEEGEFSPAYLIPEFRTLFFMLDPCKFRGQDFTDIMLCTSHASITADTDDDDVESIFLEWASGDPQYATETDWDSNDRRWSTGKPNLVGGRGVGSFNWYLTALDDDGRPKFLCDGIDIESDVRPLLKWGNETTAEEDFADDPGPEFAETEEELAARLAKTEERRAKRALAAKPETYQSLLDNYVYIGQQKRFVREADAMLWDIDAFDRYFADVEVADKSPSMALSKWILSRRNGSGIRRFETFTYRPGYGRSVEGKFNLYVSSKIEPEAGDTAIWDAHLEYLFPDLVERGHVLNWLAWTVQHLDRKAKHALLIHGEKQGTGKSFIADVLVALLGSENCTPADQDTLERAHNGFAAHTKLIVCEELRSLGHYNSKAAKQLHTLITQQRINIDEKNMTPYTLDPFLANILAMTNQWDAIRPDDSDRRYLIVSTDSVRVCEPRDARYYCRLFDLLESSTALSAILHQLMTRELGDYSGSGRAPATAAKVAMRDEASGEVEKWLIENAEEVITPYSLVNVEVIFKKLPDDLQRLRTARADIRRTLAHRFSGIAIKAPIRPDGWDTTPIRVWAVGDNAKAVAEGGGHVELWRREHKAPAVAPADDLSEDEVF